MRVCGPSSFLNSLREFFAGYTHPTASPALQSPFDEGRVRFLREHAGPEDARLVAYVDGAVTPENVLIA